MKNVIWNIKYDSTPAVIHYCKKCSKKTEYISSGQFRVNANRKYLDIWLIYKCNHCDTTWNATIYSRINPQSISRELLEGFHNNDEALSREYAMNTELLGRNGVEVQSPSYTIQGDDFAVTEPIELHIRSEYHFPIKVSAILREKLNLSQSELLKLIEHGKIDHVPKQGLRKLKLNKSITLVFNGSDAFNCNDQYHYDESWKNKAVASKSA